MRSYPVMNASGKIIGTIRLEEQTLTEIAQIRPRLLLGYEYVTATPDKIRAFTLIATETRESRYEDDD